ncbi:hypothetical protein D3C84_749740 [compost metagenome]
MRAMSSAEAENSMATQYSPIISLTLGPTMCTPSTSSVRSSARTFTKPSVSWLILARLLAVKGNLPTL